MPAVCHRWPVPERPLEKGPTLRRPLAILPVLAAAVLAACGTGVAPQTATTDTTPDRNAEAFAEIVRKAEGQTVRWSLPRGDRRLDAYVDDEVAPALAKLGVKLRRVPVASAGKAVSRVLSERKAGRRTGGSVDLVALDGADLARGRRERLWLQRWSEELPNAQRYLTFSDATLSADLGVAVDGQASPWRRTTFVYAHDSAKVATPPPDLDALLAQARSKPGRFTYPAPPDPTGSAFVRQVVAARGEDAAFAYLRELKPFMYGRGERLPRSRAALDALFARGRVDFAMAYDGAYVADGVRRGGFPKTARPFFVGDVLSRASYVTIPANAGNVAGAKVLANLLLEPELQAAKADPEVLGDLTVLDLDRLVGDELALFQTAGGRDQSPYVPASYPDLLGEPAGEEAERLDERWKRELER